MEPLPKPDELLNDTDIISPEERNSILERIDQDFTSHFFTPSLDVKYDARSSGLKFPLILALIMTILTAAIIYFSNSIFQQPYSYSLEADFSEVTDIEWTILNTYKENVEKRLNEKNNTISLYQNEIVIYDQKLTALRELINLKKETEERITAERIKLQLQGMELVQIDTEITILEKNLISSLNSDMVDFYNLSIDELNSKIDDILEDRSDTENKLEISMAEQKSLVLEKDDLSKTLETSTVPPVEEETQQKKAALDEINLKNQQATLFVDFINMRYSAILQDIKKGNFQGGKQKISQLKVFLEDQDMKESLMDPAEIAIRIELISTLGDYADLKLKEALTPPVVESDLDIRLKELETLSRGVLNGAGSDLSAEELKIRSIMEEIPGVQTALSALKKISESSATISKPDFVPKIEKKAEIKPFLLVGFISKLEFDRVTVQIQTAGIIQKGDTFFIHRSNGSGENKKLGSGTITEIYGKTCTGLLETLYDFSLKPDLKDLVYIKNKAAEN